MPKKRAPRLTREEWRVVYDCLAFIEAGEVSGGPLEGSSECETDYNQDLFDAAKAKIKLRF